MSFITAQDGAQLQAPTHSGAAPYSWFYFPNLSHSAIDASSMVVAQRGIPPILERACAGHGQGLMIGSRVIWRRPVIRRFGKKDGSCA